MGFGGDLDARTEETAKNIVDAAYNVYRELGPVLLESVNEACLFHELTVRGVKARRQVSLPIQYGGLRLESGLVIDLVVEEEIVVELKAVDQLIPVHKAQVITYLKLAKKQLGLLINFNVAVFNDGIRRVILSEK